MRLISKGSDYYDTALSYGVDKTIIYKRKCEEFDLPKGTHALCSSYWNSVRININNLPEFSKLINLIKKEPSAKIHLPNMCIRLNYMLFCGELIPFLSVWYSYSENDWSIYSQTANTNIYSMDDFTHFINSNITDRIFNGIENALTKTESYSFSNNMSIKKHLERFFNNVPKGSFEDVHHELNCPVIHIHNEGYTKNPLLREIGFAKKYDPYTAYQKLEMFISGVLGGCTPKLVEIEDKYRIAAHGFDSRSFRKGKEK